MSAILPSFTHADLFAMSKGSLTGSRIAQEGLKLCDAVASGRLEMLEFEDLAILLQRASNAAK